MSSGAGEALGPAPFGRALHPSLSMASSSSTTVISRASPDHRLLEADSNYEGDPEAEAAAGVVRSPDCVSDPVRDAGPASCPGHGLNPGVARPRPSSNARSGSDLGRGQEKIDAPSTRPDPSPRTDCGHAWGVQLFGAVHATEDRSRGKSNLTWADRARSNDGEQPMQYDPSPEHARDAEILRLKKENAELKDTLTKMANEMAEFKRMLSTKHSKTEGETTDTPVPAPIGDGPMATKRRAVLSKLKNTESQVEEIKETLVTITENIRMVAGSVASLAESVRQMQAALSDPVEGLRAMNKRIIALEIHAKLPKSALQGASLGNVEMAIAVHVESRGANYEDEQIFRATLTPQDGDQSRIHDR
ncbi:hypothetical protein HPB51_028668 [Rhipicephalus microplus]|uniref:Uncharacterized protein n=1 Tax=Rhipicephalus microplus TaxID=6941 RepID=A0A9J6CWF4_RHIMP|nr:hypothetical protein HPB51_028668 [Rhipicephalus microplus]